MTQLNSSSPSTKFTQRLLVLLAAVLIASACSAEDHADAEVNTDPADASATVQAEAEDRGATEAAAPAESTEQTSDSDAAMDAEAEATAADDVPVEAEAAMPVTSKYTEGTHYFRIQDPDPGAADTVEVVEVFSYMCPACATFQPYISRWEENLSEDVKFTRVPATFLRGWPLLATAYYTADNLGVVDQSHAAMFRAIHQQNQRFGSVEQLAEFYGQFGVSKERFLSTAQSFAVDSQMRRGNSKAQDWGITGTPSIIVDGTYRIAAGGALRSYDQMLDVANELIAKQRAQ